MEKLLLVQACRQGERPVLGGAAPAAPAAPAAGGASDADGVESDHVAGSGEGGQLDEGVQGGEGALGSGEGVSGGGGGRLCEEHDFLWAYATTPPPPTPNPNP